MKKLRRSSEDLYDVAVIKTAIAPAPDDGMIGKVAAELNMVNTGSRSAYRHAIARREKVDAEHARHKNKDKPDDLEVGDRVDSKHGLGVVENIVKGVDGKKDGKITIKLDISGCL